MSNFFSRFSSASGETPKDGIYTDKPLVFIEIQTGEELNEDDIIRYEDKYGR